MPFTAQQLTNFWTNAPQMNLSPNQRLKLEAQGLADIKNFEHFDEETFKDAFKNMKVHQNGVTAVAEIRNADGILLQPTIPANRAVIGEPLGALQAY